MKKSKTTDGTRYLQQSLWAGFPASPLVSPESEKERMIPATYGRRCAESYQSVSRHGSLLKMFVDCLVLEGAWSSSRCVLTWKLSGTKYSRLLFQLQASVRHTEETGCGLLPTNRSQENGNYQNVNRDKNGVSRSKAITLTGKINAINHGLLLTPSASDAQMSKRKTENLFVTKNGSVRLKNKAGTSSNSGLVNQIQFLPTPKSRGFRSPDVNPESTRQQKNSELNTAIGMIPTPTQRDHKDGNSWAAVPENSLLPRKVGNETGLKLHPNFAEWMMGYPIEYTALSPSEIVSFRKSRMKSSSPSKKRKKKKQK